MLADWLFKLTAFSTRPLLETAAVGSVPGAAVVGVVGLFYFVMIAVTFWLRERHAKGEFADVEPGEWKETDS